MSTLKERIFQLKKDGKSYRQIQKELNCSKGTISYYLGNNQKEKLRARMKKRRGKVHPFAIKLEHFLYRKAKDIQKHCSVKSRMRKLIYEKIRSFHQIRKGNKVDKLNFTVEDVINKFGEKPKCYLTGKEIDIYKPTEYHFDHIEPTSKGGDNTLSNLGITTRDANISKNNLSLEQYLKLCKDVLEHHGFEVKQVNKDLHPD